MSGYPEGLDVFTGNVEGGTEEESEDEEVDDYWVDVESKFGFGQDDLNLTEVGKTLMDQQTEMLFPEELCRTLRDRVEALSDDNARLKRCLQEADRKLKLKCRAPSPVKGIGRSSDMAANKIVQLSKRVRELNAELAASHRRANSAEAKLLKHQTEAPATEIKRSEPKESSDDLKKLTEKFNALNIKLCESRNQVQQLKRELKIAHKALASELGDGVPLKTALAPGWRGRAQQIISLQQKLSELNDRPFQNNVAANERSNLSVEIALRRADKERQAEHVREVERLKGELEDSKRKLDASKARIRVIAAELTALKSKVTSLQEKSDHDDQLISALTGQLGSAAEKFKDREQHVSSRLEEQISILKQELDQEKTKTTQFHSIVLEKDATISRLESKLNSQTPVHPEVPSPPEPSYSRESSSANACGSSLTDSGQDIVSSMTEAERLRLMELLTVANRRLDAERLALDRCQDQLRQERKKCVRLETKLSRLERERVGCSKATGYGKPIPKTSSQSAEMETLKDKAELLEEKCLALETRMSCLRQEREEDSRRYMNLIEETRNKFLEHLKKSNLTQKDIKASVSRVPERRSLSRGNGSIDSYPDDFPID